MSPEMMQGVAEGVIFLSKQYQTSNSCLLSFLHGGKISCQNTHAVIQNQAQIMSLSSIQNQMNPKKRTKKGK